MRLSFFAIVPLLSVASALALDLDLPKTIDIGVYFSDGSQWREAPVELLNWKSTGVAKSLLNGQIRGAASPTTFASTMKIGVLIHATEGTPAEQYRLLRLRARGDAREFRSESGGSGSELVDCKPIPVAPSIWKVELTGLPDGEYGFLSPETTPSAPSSARVFTFEIGNGNVAPPPVSAALLNLAKGLFRNTQGPGFNF